MISRALREKIRYYVTFKELSSAPNILSYYIKYVITYSG